MDRRPTFRPLSRLMGVCLLLAGALLWAGCGTPEQRYKTLSFFFDGVPDPVEQARLAEALKSGGSLAGRSVNGQPVMIFTHKPYEQQQCYQCHTGGPGALFRPDVVDVTSSACLKCHQKVTTEFAVMHGPVAAVECLWCHTPHEADNKALLKEHSPGVCLQCHSRELLDPKPPQHMDADASCLDCHFGHGADRHGLLRPTALVTPTTAPATQAGDGGRS
jgi:predicted CXXCH cytochrome family protein